MGGRTGPARERLVAAAAEMIGRRGYHASGVSDLLAAAGVPSGVLYHHFGSKQALAAEALERAGAGVLAAFDAAPGAGVLARCEALVDAWEQRLVGSDYTEGCPIAVTALESATGPGELRHVAATAYESWLARLEQGLRAEGHDGPAARTRALRVLAAVEGALLLAQTLRSLAPLRATRSALPALLTDHREDLP
jgi:TetR/AcrR family transcriptional repressor of lmrAB and yxaGH operons